MSESATEQLVTDMAVIVARAEMRGAERQRQADVERARRQVALTNRLSWDRVADGLASWPLVDPAGFGE